MHAPMATGDGLLLRVKPFGGRLRADDLRAVASVSEAFGNGVVEITSRGNLQLRGFSEASAPEAAARLVAAGLADADPAREARRNVIAVPPCDDALVAELEELLAETQGLPPKFCVSVGEARADVRLVGGRIVARAPGYDELIERIEAALSDTANLVMAGLVPATHAGMRDKASNVWHGADAADVPADESQQRGTAWVAGTSPAMTKEEEERLLIGLPFGQTDAAGLRALADLAGNAVLRVTPWRAFRVEGTHDPAAFVRAGFITDDNDPRRSISACPGAPACASASVPARADAAVLAARGVRNVHVSGCAKGCARPAPSVTLVGIGGRYGFIRYGRAGDAPAITGLTIEQAAEMLA
ncbi:MAG: hypothetical protein JSR21_18905 [Proteobacteria bacterium]|nr:hypothetical protein [Pseudomonadota bacterium]